MTQALLETMAESLRYWLPLEKPIPHGIDGVSMNHHEKWREAKQALALYNAHTANIEKESVGNEHRCICSELLRELKNAKAIIEKYVPSDAMGIDMTGDLSEPHLTQSWARLDEHLHYINQAISRAELPQPPEKCEVENGTK